MNDEDVELMDREEARFHPRLLLLEEFEGEIEGKKKFFKSLFHFRQEIKDVGLDEWTFTHKSFGPTDEGLSKAYRAYEKFGLVVIEKDGVMYIYKITEKGSKVARGLRRGLRMLFKDMTEEREQSLKLVAKVNKDRAGSEIEEDWEIAKKKSEAYNIDQ